MTISLASARKWCNASELTLVSASFDRDIAWTPALLRAKIERARKLRDKHRDQKRKMKRGNRAATGTKVGTQVTAIAVADKRAQIFDEALARFTAKLEKLNAQRKLAALKAATAAAVQKKRAAQAAATGRRAAPAAPAQRVGKPSAAPTVSAAAQLKRKNQMARVRARNARNQAKRDSR
jgi:hypothetical protein